MEYIYNNLMAVAFILATLGGLIWGIGNLIWKVALWKGNTDKDLATFTVFMNEVRNDIKEILKYVSPGQPLTERKSPIGLTSFGERITKEIEAPELAEQYLETVASTISGRNPYEIQTACMDYAQTMLMPELKRNAPDKAEKIEVCAYRHGRHLYEVLEVIGVVLRDKMLDKFNIPKEGY